MSFEIQCHRLKHEWNTMSFETKWSAMKHNVICSNTMSSVEAQRSTMSFVETQCHLLDLNVIRWKWHLLEHHVISEAWCNTITMSIVESEWNNMRHDETHIICWSTMSCGAKRGDPLLFTWVWSGPGSRRNPCLTKIARKIWHGDFCWCVLVFSTFSIICVYSSCDFGLCHHSCDSL